MNKGALEQSRFEMIEAYVLGRMSIQELELFEEEMDADGTLRAEVAMQRENILAVELGGMERMVKQLGAEQPRIARSRIRAWSSALKYAAIVAVVLGGAYFWLARVDANERLYADYHVVDPGLPVPMSATDAPAFHDAMVAFKLGDFEEARNKWTPLLLADPTNDTLRFYIASTDLERGMLDDAIAMYQGLAENGNSEFQRKSRWYLFLSYLKKNDTVALRAMGMDNDPIYGERVRAILSDPRL